MTSFASKKPIAAFFLGIFLISQLLLAGSYALVPKPAKAVFGIGDFTFTTEVGNVYDVLKDIGLAALRQVAIQYANKFLTKFVSKLQDKYKIRNYLYYDKVLSDYYLNRYISDNITDPDLRGIYSLLEKGFISGASTGTTGGPDPRAALIPRLNKAISAYYVKQGGIDPNKCYNPASNVSDREYFSTCQAYFSNPQSFTAQNLQSQFGAFQSSATSASQLEVLVGNGLKAGRVIGGVCKLEEPPPPSNSSAPTDSPQGCAASGGVWQASALDQARSFIDNPTQFTASWMDSAIKQITGNNFDPTNYKAVIGSFLGNFLFNQLNLDRSSNDTLPDSPYQYTAEAAGNPNGTPIDIDGDGITDGYDINNDGNPDICIYGGANGAAGPPCAGSMGALSTGPVGGGGATICAAGEISLDVIYHAEPQNKTNVPYDRLSVHNSTVPTTANSGPDMADDDAFHIPTDVGLADFSNIILRASNGGGAYVSASSELQASQAAGKDRHTIVPDIGSWIGGFEPGGSGSTTIDLSAYKGDTLNVGAFLRGTQNGDTRAEVCALRSNIQGGIVVPNVP